MRKNIILIITVQIWFCFAAFQIQAQDSTTPNSGAAKPAFVKTATVAPPQNLMVPPMAYDDSSITAIWSKPSDYSNVVSYNVYQEGSLVGNTKNLFYTLTGLEPDTPYSIVIKSVDSAGTESAPSNKVIKSTVPAMKVFNVADYGAVGDGTTLNTAAIQKAIDECTPGGKVLIPSGTFISGALFLKSNITLQIDGTLQGSDNAADYPQTSKRFPYYSSGNNFMGLINAYTTDYYSITNVRICGSGTVNGSSDTVGFIRGHANTILANNQVAASEGDDSDRADMVVIKGVDGLYIGELTFVNPAMHTIFISYSKNITVNGINVSTYDIHNADGINVCTSDTTYIFNSTFDTGDDCINFNAGVGEAGVKENYSTKNVRVFNCLCKRGHGGVVFGSFTAAWFQDFLVEDCIFDGTDRGLRFKTGLKQGGGAKNILCRDIEMKDIVKDAIFFDSTYGCDYPSGGPGQFKDITVKNITCTNLKRYGIYVNGLAGTPHTNLSLSNVSIDGAKAGGAYIKYCTNSTFDTINITNSSPPWVIDDNSTAGLVFKNCSPSPEYLSEADNASEPAAESPAEAMPPDHNIRIVIVGDTTAKDNKGWGPGFKSFLNDYAECINTAVGGRSTKRFIDEGRWLKALALKGDYYLIQFGHNDESAKDETRTDPNTTYREYMTRYIDECRAAGAKPILITSLVRREWDPSGSGKINSSLEPYTKVVRALAKEKNVPLIDLHARSKELCEQLGKEKCDEFSPIKANNQIDNTHLDENASVMFGRIVAEELIKAVPELKPYFHIEEATDANSTAEAKPNPDVRIVLVGDSTVTDKQGWGPGFKSFLTDRAECINVARGGRSSKSFINEGLWTEALALKGDYYLIQFGHNDEPGKGERSTDPNTTYREFMTKYVDETRAIGAKPVLVTSLVRRQWDKSGSGKINSSLTPYVEVVKELAKEKNVPLVDLHASSKQLCEQLGKEKCWEFSPIKDNNQIDNTHLNAEGSMMFGQLVVEELIKAVPELKPYFHSESATGTNSTAEVSAVFSHKGLIFRQPLFQRLSFI